MKEKLETIPVMIRVWRVREQDIFALFPTEPADIYGDCCLDCCLSYQHIGQHCGADYGHCILSSRPATAAESAPLVKELERIGYQLRVIKRTSYKHHEQRREASSARKAVVTY